MNYEYIIEEIKAIITEGVYNSRMDLLETYHQVGQILASQSDVLDISKVANDSGISLRNLQRARQFYLRYPDITKLPEGKNISWSKMINKYLPEHKEKEVVEYEICDKCNGKGKIKL